MRDRRSPVSPAVRPVVGRRVRAPVSKPSFVERLAQSCFHFGVALFLVAAIVWFSQPPEAPATTLVEQADHSTNSLRPDVIWQGVSVRRDSAVVPAAAHFEAGTRHAHPDISTAPLPMPPLPAPNLQGSDSLLPLPSSLSPAVGGPTFVLRFQDAPWDLVLRRFAREAGLSLQIDSMPSGTFSYADEIPKSATEALDVLNEQLLQHGFLIARRERAAVVLKAREKIPDAFIPQVIASDLPRLGRNEIASLVMTLPAGSSEQLAKDLQTLLTPVGSILSLPQSNRLLINDLGGNLRRIHELVMATTESRRPSYVYKLRNTSAVEVAAAVSELLGNGRNADSTGDVRTASFQASPGANGAPFVLVVPEPTTNSILLSGTQYEIDEACRLISQLDVCPPQVLIQALLVEVELGNTDEFGIELGVQDSVLFDRSVINNLVTLTQTNTNPNGVQTTTQQVISQTSEPGFNFNNKPLGNNTSVSPGRVGSQALSNLAVGRINGDLGFGGLVLSAGSESINVLIRALAAKYKVDVLSRPQITTMDNQPAHIQIGQQVPVIDGVTITPVGSASPVIRQDQAGIILRVTPRVGPDNVVINVVAEKSQFQTAPGTGVPIFTDVTNGNVIEAPIKDLTTAQTIVSVRNGECIALGGMITKSMQIVERKVPVLGDIPYVGLLFRYDLQQQRRKELLIFLTPHVINDPQEAERLKREEVARTEFPYADAEQMHGPILEPKFEENTWPLGVVPLTEADLHSPGKDKPRRWWQGRKKSRDGVSTPWVPALPAEQPSTTIPPPVPPADTPLHPSPNPQVVPARAVIVRPVPTPPARLPVDPTPTRSNPAPSASPYAPSYRSSGR